MLFYILSLSLVFFSGMTGLIYQVTWHKYLAIFLGSHSLATALVLSTFFLFMALGYFIIGRHTHRLMHNKLKLYGVVEGLIGAYGLFSPFFFHWLSGLFSFHVESSGLELLINFSLASLFIGFPTFLMGGTIPILTQGLVFSFNTSHRIHSLIYSLNTFGAFVGTLLAGFVLLEALGLANTIVVASVINLTIFVASYVISAASGLNFEGVAPEKAPSQVGATADEPSAADGADLPKNIRWGLYAVSFLSGFYVFSLENLVIRMAGVSLGSTNYTYSMIVASFILAIAIGSSMVSLMRKLDNHKVLLWVQGALVTSSILLYLSIPHWPYLINRVRLVVLPTHMNFGIYWALILITFSFILLIPVMLMGMNLPLLFNFLKERGQYLSAVVGRVYSLNALGCFLGALVGGYYLFHFLEAEQVFKVSLVLMSLTFVALALLFQGQAQYQKLSYTLAAIMTMIILALPHWPMKNFVPGLYLMNLDRPQIKTYQEIISHYRQQSQEEELLYSSYDADSLISVGRDPLGELTLYINGKPDAMTTSDHRVRSLNALIPLYIAPKMEDVFIVGLGTGLSSGLVAQHPENQRLRVVELAQGVIEALPHFEDYNHGVLKFQDAEKIDILHGDAYKVLSSDYQKYDIIISEPTNPWIAGVEKLFSLEFLERAKSRLKPHGIYSQWFPFFSMDEETILAILRNYAEVFEHIRIWSTSPHTYLLVASQQPLVADEEIIQTRYEKIQSHLDKFGFHDPFSLLGMETISPLLLKGLSFSQTRTHSLERPIVAFESQRAFWSSQRVSLGDLVPKVLLRPLPKNRPSDLDLLLTQVTDHLSRDFFVNMVDLVSFPTTDHQLIARRLRLLAHDLGAIEVPDSFAKTYQSYLYLTQAQKELPFADYHWETDFPLLFDTFYKLLLAEFEVSSDQLNRALPQNCSKPLCEEFRSGIELFKSGEIQLALKKIPQPQGSLPNRSTAALEDKK